MIIYAYFVVNLLRYKLYFLYLRQITVSYDFGQNRVEKGNIRKDEV